MKGIVLDELVLVIDRTDTVGTAIADIPAGTRFATLDDTEVTVEQDIDFGHKLALERIEPAGTVRKYGESIGRATRPISPGEWVHTHNLESDRGRGDRRGGQHA